MPSPWVLGFTDYQTIYLGPGACLGVVLLWQDGAGDERALNPDVDVDLLEAEGALVLEHELGHILYGADERMAECYGVTAAPALLARLGVRGSRAVGILADVKALDLQENTPCQGAPV